MGFAELKRALGIESSGNMAFHLAKLKNLVTTRADGNYDLTDDGREALWSIGNISGTRTLPGPEIRVKRRGRTGNRLIIVSLIGVLLVLGSATVLQEEQISTQQAQISAQQQEIALYVKQVQPFTNGQSASLVLGQSDFVSYENLATGNASPSGLNNPTETIFDSSGNLWVVDSSANRILEFRPPFSDGMKASVVIGQKNLTGHGHGPVAADQLGNWQSVGGGYGPTGAAFDAAGDLWVADTPNNRILEFKPPFSDGMAASLVVGERNFTTNYPAAWRGFETWLASQDGLSLPTRVAFDHSGDMWVLDSGDNRVLGYKPPFTNGMKASLVIGQKDFVERVYSATRDRLNLGIGDIATDSNGNLWVGDSLDGRILEFTPPFINGMNASVVLGQANFTARANLRPSGVGYGPGAYNLGYALAFDSAGDLWASSNNRLLEFRPPFATNMLPSLEIGQPDFTTIAWVGGQNGLHIPGHPSFDRAGNLWVPDDGNNRVLEFASAYPTASSLGGATAQPFGGLWPVVWAALILGAGAVTTYVGLAKRRHREPGPVAREKTGQH